MVRDGEREFGRGKGVERDWEREMGRVRWGERWEKWIHGHGLNIS